MSRVDIRVIMLILVVLSQGVGALVLSMRSDQAINDLAWASLRIQLKNLGTTDGKELFFNPYTMTVQGEKEFDKWFESNKATFLAEAHKQLNQGILGTVLVGFLFLSVLVGYLKRQRTFTRVLATIAFFIGAGVIIGLIITVSDLSKIYNYYQDNTDLIVGIVRLVISIPAFVICYSLARSSYWEKLKQSNSSVHTIS